MKILKNAMGGGVVNTCFSFKNKGFTLAELLAVIAILGVIALIAFPAVNKIIKSSKEKAYESQKEIILSSAKNWGLDHLGELSENNDTYLTIEELKRDGYIEAKQVINPITDEEMTGCIVVHYDDSYNQYIYEYNEAGCDETSKLPIITLNGNRTMSIEINGTYTELGATAKYQQEDISSSIVISGSVDTTKVGTYYIKYNVSYNGVSAREVVRVVKVVREGEPTDPDTPSTVNGITIALSPNGTTNYSKATTVNVTVTSSGSNSIETITYKLDDVEKGEVVDNKIVLDTDGLHVIEVTATDNKGNSNTITSRSYQIDVTPPEIHFSEEDTGVTLTSNLVSIYNLKNGVSVVDNNSINIDNVIVTGNLSALPGVYQMTYKATDIAGNVTTKTRKITVVSEDGSSGSGGSLLSNIVTNASGTLKNDPGSNTRYVGTNPNNYVMFDNELWRIIGVFNGQAKIIRNDFYSTSIAWDTTNKNNWSTATLQETLNTIYLNNMENTSKSLIDRTHVWQLGGRVYSDTANFTRSNMYSSERSTTVQSGNPTVWTGAIGLMYPSDYGYATSSTNTVCNTTSMYNWSSGTAATECRDKNWLYKSSNNQWTLTPASDGANYAFRVYPNGTIHGYNNVSNTLAARPVLYLKSSVKVVSGSGTAHNPYKLGI